MFDFKRRTPIKTAPPGELVLGVEPANWTLVFKLFSTGDQLRLKLTNLIQFEISQNKYYSFYYLEFREV